MRTPNHEIHHSFGDWNIKTVSIERAVWIRALKPFEILGDFIHSGQCYCTTTADAIQVAERLIAMRMAEKIYPSEVDVARFIPAHARFLILKRQKWRCSACGCPLKFSAKSKWDGENAEFAHVFPYARRAEYQRGPAYINELSNLEALCPKHVLERRSG